MKKVIALFLALSMLVLLFPSCNKNKEPINDVNEALDTSKDITLKICGPWEACKAIENASVGFGEKYPNCQVEYEFVQNYQESIINRLENSPDSIDLFICGGIQEGSDYLPYAEELYSHESLDLSQTNKAIMNNSTYHNKDKSERRCIYSIPFGGDVRGMYVNKTLLSSLGLSVPTNVNELLDDCEKLKEAGYVPMNGNPLIFSQSLLYPYVCNLIAHSDNYKETYREINKCEEGISKLFEKPLELCYILTENNYYNYKYVETEKKMFTDNSNEGCARYFFNVLDDGNGFEKKDDVGDVAFMPGILSQKQAMDTIKEDYHSKIDYEFIMSPVSDEGGFAYISPGQGIAVNKHSQNVDWAVEFLDFIFESKENTVFAKDMNYIPNIADSFGFVGDNYGIPDERITDVGKATFDYDFYSIIVASLLEISKGNNPKYMDTDENGNPVMYSLEYYMQNLENAFAGQREGKAG